MPDSTSSHSQPNGHAEPGPPAERPRDEDEISLLDLLLVLARNRRLILGTVAVFGALGLLVALTSPAEYTSSATVIREVDGGPGGLGALGGLSALRGLGISIGEASKGLTAEAYPDILTSREVRLAVVRDTFYFREADTSMTFVAYVNREPGLMALVKRYTIGLPGVLLGALRGDAEPASAGLPDSSRVHRLSEEQERAVQAIEGLVETTVDPATGLMTVSVTTGEAVLSAALTQSFVHQLVERVRAIRTEKARKTVQFIQERFEEAQGALQGAEEDLARFQDRNVSLQSARLRTEQARLERQVSFKSQLYSEVQAQLTQAQIELQRSQPIITLLEQPVPALTPSGPRRLLIVLLSLVLGGLAGVGGAFVKNAFATQSEDRDEQAKLDEVKRAFIPQPLHRRMKKQGKGKML